MKKKIVKCYQKIYARLVFCLKLGYVFFSLIGIPTNHSKPTSFSLRVDNAVPLVTQAHTIQPLQIRAGILSQVSLL